MLMDNCQLVKVGDLLIPAYTLAGEASFTYSFTLFKNE